VGAKCQYCGEQDMIGPTCYACLPASAIAFEFHETYERLAPDHGWQTQERSRKYWEDVPPENKKLMVAVVRELIERGVITSAKGPLG
jgi:hypothetical protein